MIDVFGEVVLPVLIVAGLGALVGRWRNIGVGPLSTTVFYLFGPALIFSSLSTTHVTLEIGSKVVATMAFTLIVMLSASVAWSYVRGHDSSLRAGVALVITSPNIGNMGLPVVALAFGQTGLQIGVVTYVTGAVLANSAGTAIASMARDGWRRALRVPLRYPHLYAAGAGILVRVIGIDLPTPISVPASTLGAAAIPVMLVVLGLHLKDGIAWSQLADTFAANVGRLVVAPLIAWCLATALGLEGANRAAVAILAAMPTAVVTTILATEFDAQPEFVTQVVITSTLASLATLTVAIYIVR